MDLLLNNYMRSSGNGPTWCVEIDPPSRPVLSYWEETKLACEMIYEQREAPLQLCYSGGLDSEFVLSTFLHLGIDVEVVIMKTQYNHPETQYAFKFCDNKNITPTVIDLDLDKFVQSGEMIKIAESMKVCNPMIPANMWLINQLDGTVITGNDPPHMKKNIKDGLWYLDEEEVIHSQFNFFRQNSILGTPFLLSYTPEQMLSFLLDPTMQDLANNKIPGKLGTNSTKVFVFNNGSGYNLEQRKKLTGYEEALASNHFLDYPDVKTVFSWYEKWLGTSDHQYHELIEKLSNGIPSKGWAVCSANT